jgi:hypothetical protein
MGIIVLSRGSGMIWRLGLTFVVLAISSVQAVKAQDISLDSAAVASKAAVDMDTTAGVPVRLQRKWSYLQAKSLDSLLLPPENNRFRKELYHFLMRDNSSRLVVRRSPNSNYDLVAKDGKIIRNIEFRNTDIFRQSVRDTVYKPLSGLEKTLNNMHNDTRSRILSRHLLLHQGEPLDVFLISENERILRELPFINDARFLVRAIPGSPDSIDLVLLTQDLFPVGFEADISRSNAGSASIWNQNMFGYGLQSAVTVFWDGDHQPLVGYGLLFSLSSLAGSFTTARLEYVDRWNMNSFLVDFSRDFRTADFKYAGGALFENSSVYKEITLLDTTIIYNNLKYTDIDLWGGRMFRLSNHSSITSSGIYLTGRVNYYINHEGPETLENYLYPYQDKTLLLFSTGYSRRGFIKDNLIYTFGRTEDVPYGYHFDLTAGVEKGQYTTRPYISAGAAMGRYFNGFGYGYGQMRYGTFLDEGRTEQGTFQIQAQYFTRLYNWNRFQYRNFINLNYLNGVRRFEGEFTSLENRGGIEGLTSESMRGNDKLSLNLESVVFSPYRFLGFRFAFFGSVDLGLISQYNLSASDSKFFSAVRLGARIRNEQLAFNTFEISFAFYPGMPVNGQAEYISVGTLTRMRFNDFFPHKPDIVRYQ